MLCLNFTVDGQANKAVDITATGLQIGQPVPDISINSIHNFKSNSAKISDFKGKLLIIDFWATWCSPCIAMLPKMDSLQRQFGDKVQFLSVTYQSEKEAMPFLEKLEKQSKRKYILPVVTNDTKLNKLFPHVFLPHYVWIDQKGFVKAITDFNEINAEGINKALNNVGSLTKKADLKIAYDEKKPFLINGNGGDGKNLISHSLLTGFSSGISGGYSYDPIDIGSYRPRKISCWNKSISYLFRIAYQEDKSYIPLNRVVFNVKDTLSIYNPYSGKRFLDWQPQNTYCYELIVPPEQAKQAFKIMQADLSRMFPKYEARMEKQKVRCLALVRTSLDDKIGTTGGKSMGEVTPTSFVAKNAFISYLIVQLSIKYLSKYPLPIIDDTHYSNKVDLDLEANLSDVTSLNNALKKYDLAFVEKDIELDMLIIKDKTN
nr:TlpA disulfide reductase family protein [Pedobacter sp. ASV28]